MSVKKLSPNEIKLNNRQMIYDYIRKHDSVSKQDIVIALNLSLPTVTQNLQYLEDQRLIDTSQKIKNTGGRNATAYTYIKNAKSAIGVYITANHINAVAVNLAGDMTALVKERVAFALEDDAYLKRLGEVIEQVKKKAQISADKLLGVGIAVPGLVSDDGEYVTYGPTFHFTGKKREEIARYIPYLNRLFHDSYVAGYAETRMDKRMQNAFYINLCNSVGGSVVIHNEIYKGDSHKGGEVGHMTVVTEGGAKCYCGQYGCFDSVCRAGILDEYTDGNLEVFFELLEKGDQTAVKMWNQYLDHLALAVNNIRVLFDGVIILGGYVGAYMKEYMQEICSRVDARHPFEDRAKDYLSACKYTVEAAAAGAAMRYIDEFTDSI